MRLLFDQGVPLPLRRALSAHAVETTWQHGWSELSNGALLTKAEAAGFELFITTDQNLRHQQNLSGRRIAIFVLSVSNWPVLQLHASEIAAAVDSMRPGEYREWLPSQNRD